MRALTPSAQARSARLTLLLAAVVFAACGGNDTASMDVAEESMAAGADGGAVVGFQSLSGSAGAPQIAPPLPSRQASPRMLIRTGYATLEVEALEPAVQAVRRIAEQAGGYVSNLGISGGRDQVRSASLTMRIPSARFDETVASLDSLGEIETVRIDSEDVGEQHADLERRLSNARRLEERLLELLETRTGSLEDVLAAERELARVREQIEGLDAALRGLNDRVAMSSISLSLHEPEPLFSTSGENVMARSFRQAGRNFIGFVAGLIASLGVILPLALIAAILWWLWRRRRRRARATYVD
ncbi:MAG TPA: DUF4349 domain-containing protein [Longimicrobiales bacterium]